MKHHKTILYLVALIILIDAVRAESLAIESTGYPGIPDANPEYTASRVVYIILDFNASSTVCSCGNLGWDFDPWQSCLNYDNDLWMLSEEDGNKTVVCRINHTDSVVTEFNDSIYYNHTGAGLDTTPPIPPNVIDDGDFTNNNQSLHLILDGAYDPESALLEIPLVFTLRIWENNALIVDWTSPTNQTEINYSIDLAENKTYAVNVTVINSAGLNASSSSDGITIDVTKPTVIVDSSSHPNQSLWHSNGSIAMNWSGTDHISGIYGYSYILTTNPFDEPDNIPEGNLSNLSGEISANYVRSTGIYYFKIKPLDKAGNWGNIITYIIKIDLTPPSKPDMENVVVASTSTLNLSWSESFDNESGVDYYYLQVSSNPDYSSPVFNASVGNTLFKEVSVTSGLTYYARVKAVNKVNLSSQWSDEEAVEFDTTPPNITFVTPLNNDNVSTLTPTLIVRTDEIAHCAYQSLVPWPGPITDFSFTNDLTHEASLTLTFPLPLQGYNITCTDNSNNTATKTLIFKYVKATGVFSVQADLSGRVLFNQQIFTFDAVIKFDGTPASGLNYNKFHFKLGGKELQEYSVMEKGNGVYSVSIRIPEGSANPEILEVFYGNQSYNLTGFSVEPMKLQVDYAGLQSAMSNIIFKNFGGFVLGVASESSFVQTQPSRITADPNNGDVFIFMTKPDADIERKNDLLRKKEFTSKNLPTFGSFVDEDKQVLSLSLSYPNILIKGNETVQKGRHSLLLKNIRLENNPEGKSGVYVSSQKIKA
ncbi:fibronectin type III domain-containing protein [Candidatus Woesearchaeota archaeon]|nr:MAG: fibronectin type III domain-containing protein [Candidatus Woesearchaeota archaeon]